MAGTDYAADLLGATGAQSTAQPTDYASDLLGGAGKPAARDDNPLKSKKLAIDKLDLANRDAGVNDSTTADFMTLTKASMVEDPETKLKIYAKARFPGLPEAQALSRYGMIDGEPVYLGDDNKLYREHPTGFASWMKRGVATVAGAPLETAGSVAGAVIGAPAGPLASAALGAAGAAGGKGLDRVVANVAFDEPQDAMGNLKAMGTSGLFSLGGSVVGAGLAKYLGRNVAKDIAKLDTAKTADITRKAQAIGVDLNPAQSTNLPSVKAKYDVLASMPTSRDIIADGARAQADDAYKAAEKFLARVSPVDGVDEAGNMARTGAAKVIGALTKERADAAGPLYRKAFDEFQGIPPEFLPVAEELMSRPSMKQAARKAVRLAEDEGVILSNPQNSLLGMHYMKLALGDMIEGAAIKGSGPTSKRSLVGLKNELVQMMDEFSPTYKQVRDVFTHFTPNIESVKDGIISRVADLGDEQAHRASQMIFSGNQSPEAVGRMRLLFEKSGLKDDWNAILRAHLQDTFEQAGKQTMTGGLPLNQAPKWQVAMTGNPRQYRILEKAMDPAQLRNFRDMMDVFEAMGRTASEGQGSQTMGRQEGAQVLRQEAGSGAAATVANLFSPQNVGSKVAAWLDEARLGQHAAKMAEIMTSPDGVKRLKELRRLSPRDEKFIAGAANLFGISLAPNGVGLPESESSQ